MKFDNLFCCAGCAIMFRPTKVQDLCPKCEQAEQRRLAEIERDADLDFAIRCAK